VPTELFKKLDEARADLESNGFVVNAVAQPRSDIDKGVVFDQDPKGGTQAPRGSTVTLYYSGGEGQVAVPKVVGLNEAAAKSLIENAGLIVNEVQQPDDNVQKGTVISQTPTEGTMVDKKTVVTIVVSSGKNQVAVPDVTGQSIQTATNTLTQAGFKVATKPEPSETVPANKVITTNPAPGAQVPPGSVVIIIVSSGPPPTTQPPTTPSTAAPSTTKAPSTTSPASSTSSTAATTTSTA
jgi:serine/threonine-protein kinase